MANIFTLGKYIARQLKKKGEINTVMYCINTLGFSCGVGWGVGEGGSRSMIHFFGVRRKHSRAAPRAYNNVGDVKLGNEAQSSRRKRWKTRQDVNLISPLIRGGGEVCSENWVQKRKWHGTKRWKKYYKIK